MSRKKSKLARRSGDFGKRMVRCFTVLDRVGIQRSRFGFLGTRELVIYSGVSYRSLTKVLPAWLKAGYIERRESTADNVGDYEYRLLEPGRQWLYKARRELPMYQAFYNDLNKWVRCMDINSKILLNAKFNTMVECIDMMINKVPADMLDHVNLSYDNDGFLTVEVRQGSYR